MTIKAVTYYQIVCDGDPSCKAQPSDEYSAWSTEDAAQTEAVEYAEWGYDEKTGEHYCPQHTPTCEPGQHVREYEDDRCTRCGQWPEDDEKEFDARALQGKPVQVYGVWTETTLLSTKPELTE